MSFDPYFWEKRKSSRKKYPNSRKTFNLMKNSLDTHFSEDSKERLSNYMVESQKEPERVVPKEELLEMRELRMEMLRLNGLVRIDAERLNAKNYGTKLSIVFNFLGLLLILYAFYHSDLDGFDFFNWLSRMFWIISGYGWSLCLLTASKIIGHAPIKDDDEKIKKRFNVMKKNMKKSTYKMAELLKEQKKVVGFFLNNYMKMRGKYMEIFFKRAILMCLNGLPVVLLLANCFCYYGIRAYKKEKEEAKIDVWCILTLVQWSLALVFPFFMPC